MWMNVNVVCLLLLLGVSFCAPAGNWERYESLPPLQELHTTRIPGSAGGDFQSCDESKTAEQMDGERSQGTGYGARILVSRLRGGKEVAVVAKSCVEAGADEGEGGQGNVVGPRASVRGCGRGVSRKNGSLNSIEAEMVTKGNGVGKARGGRRVGNSTAVARTDGTVDNSAVRKGTSKEAEGDEDLLRKKKKNRLCKQEGCKRQPTYAEPGDTRPDFCAAHRWVSTQFHGVATTSPSPSSSPLPPLPRP